jgi:hypothetical protein
MKAFGDALINILVLGGILILAALLTNLFTRKMYNRCPQCRNLNAKRRSHCRVCGTPIDEGAPGNTPQ